MIVAAFNSPSVAQAAIRDLENARIPSADIKSYTKDEPTYQEYRTRQPEHQGGFWSWLIGEEPTQTQEYGAYDTSLASGHTVVTVTVDEVHADAAMGILNQHGPHDHPRDKRAALRKPTKPAQPHFPLPSRPPHLE